jgi:hypothetical protein
MQKDKQPDQDLRLSGLRWAFSLDLLILPVLFVYSLLLWAVAVVPTTILLCIYTFTTTEFVNEKNEFEQLRNSNCLTTLLTLCN